jgi:hypothetical protein
MTRNTKAEGMTRPLIGVVRPWTDQDDSDLLDFDDQRRTLREAASHLNRGEAECAARLEQLSPRATCICGGKRWVCEAHRDKPAFHDDCAGPAEPCPVCNPSDRERPPALPPGFKIDHGSGDG